MDLKQLLGGVLQDYDRTWSESIQRRRRGGQQEAPAVTVEIEAEGPEAPGGSGEEALDEETRRKLIALLEGSSSMPPGAA